jgi:predicted dinucleotide-binding enzyme
MDIGILGAGHIGGTVGKLWAAAGHNVCFAAQDLAALAPLLAEAGDHASAGEPAQAVAFGQVVLVALPAAAVTDVLATAGSLDGRIMIHAANAFARGGNAGLPLSTLQERFPAARWVRGYNTLTSRVLREQHHRADPYALLLSGDDEDAKKIVAGLVRDSGFAPVDVGSTADAVLQDPGSPLWNNPMTESEAQAQVAKARAQGAAAPGDPIATAVRALTERGPDDPAWWFRQLTRCVFQAGLSWRVVDAKWPAFQADFHDFDPHAVAAMTDAEIAAVESDPRVIRNVRKIEATVRNAAVFLDLLAEHGSMRGYLGSFADPHQVLTDLTRRFAFIGETAAWRLLTGAARELPSR